MAAEAKIGNPRLTETETADLAEVTGMLMRGAEIEAKVRERRDGNHAHVIRWIRNYAASHQDISAEALLRSAMRLYSDG